MDIKNIILCDSIQTLPPNQGSNPNVLLSPSINLTVPFTPTQRSFSIFVMAEGKLDSNKPVKIALYREDNPSKILLEQEIDVTNIDINSLFDDSELYLSLSLQNFTITDTGKYIVAVQFGIGEPHLNGFSVIVRESAE